MEEREELRALRQQLEQAFQEMDYSGMISAAKQILAMEKNDARAWELLTGAYIAVSDAKHARLASQAFLQVAPDAFMAHFLKARVEYLEEHYEKALETLLVAKERFQGRTVDNEGSLLGNLLGNVYKMLGDHEKGLHYYRTAIDPNENWEELLTDFSSYLFNLHYPDLPREQLFAEHVRYDALFQGKVKPFAHDVKQLSERYARRKKIKVGYISPDIREHVVVYFSYKLLTRYTRERFHVTCYAMYKEDAISEDVKKQIDCWRNVEKLKLEEIARIIHSDEIDILVDLAGHTAHSGLPVLAYKPAPVQLSGIGYFDTTGLRAVDYYLSDRHCDPPGQNDAYFTEQLIQLPYSHFCYTAPDTMPPCREAPCLRKGFVTFGSFNNFSKSTDAMLTVWKEILQSLPGAKLLLKSKLFRREAGRAYTKKRLTRLGFPMERVEFRPESILYLPEYYDVDIALDTYPYPGGGTTCDALCMGVPVITLAGERHGSRFGYSLLKNLALEDCIASSTEEYKAKALALAKDPDRLNMLHLHLRTRMQRSPLMDGALYMREVEAAYEEIWQAFLAQRKAVFSWPAAVSEIEDVARLREICLKAEREGDCFRALEAYGRLRALRAADGQAAVAAAKAYLALWEYALAKKTAVEALDWGADALEARLVLAKCHEGQFALREAARIYEKIIADCKQRAGTLQEGVEREAWARLLPLYAAMGEMQKYVAATLLYMETLSQPLEKARAYSALLWTMRRSADGDEAWISLLRGQYQSYFKGIAWHSHQRETDAKLRVGYLLPDLQKNGAAQFCDPLLTYCDRDRWQVFCYLTAGEMRQAAKRIQATGHAWRDLRGLPPEEAARAIHGDRIDLLVDLSGHATSEGLLILAHKPAPVQLCGIGYCEETGLAAVDYLLTDGRVDAPDAQVAGAGEKWLRLPHCHFCYVPAAGLPERKQAPFQENGFVTACNCDCFAPLSEAALGLWKAVLEAVPTLRLRLRHVSFAGAAGRGEAMARLAAQGFPTERLRCLPPLEKLTAFWSEADIVLDVTGCADRQAICEALYMGAPVVTLAGKRRGARFGYSILVNAGLAAYVAFSEAEYVEKAVALARDAERLRALQLGLRAQLRSSPLMDGKLYAREVEAAYLDVWQDYLVARTGQTPQRRAEERTARCREALQRKDYALALRMAWDLLDMDAQCGDACYFLSRVYFELQAHDDAISYAQAALEKDGCYEAEAYQVLGLAQQAKLRYKSAAEAFECGLAVARGRAGGSDALLAALARNLGSLRLGMGEHVKAREAYLLAAQMGENLRVRAESYSSYLLCQQYDWTLSREAVFAAHQKYGGLFADTVPRRKKPPCAGRIKIGYLSPDFRQHVMFYFYHQLLACYDKTQFHVTCYSLGPEDAFTTHLKGLVDDWRDLRGKSYEESAALIRADEIDILFDLAGHSAGSGLPVLAYRPAPVQISGLGYMSTTGLGAVDFFVGDVFTDPSPEDDAYFTERLLRLSQSHFCYAGRSDVPEPQGAPCLQNGYVTFCSFNQYAKLTDEVLAAWKEILDRTPASRLVLKCQVFASEEVRSLALRRLERLGFAAERIALRPATDTYMREYLEMDIALDTYPYQGGGTTCDALYMGVPVVTLLGDRHSRRFGYSILKNVGLEELVAEDLASYADKAVALAADAELLDILHKNLRGMLLKSPLMDEKAYVQEMETLYRYLAENGAESF